MKRNPKQNEKLTGIVRVGTRVLECPDAPDPVRFVVADIFVRRGQRMFVLETWLSRKRKHSYAVVCETVLRMFFGRCAKGRAK